MIPDEELKNVTGGCGADLFEEDNPADPRIRFLELEIEEMDKWIAWVNDWKAERRNRELIKARSLKRGSKGECEPQTKTKKRMK